jgi:hypothetical protein
MAGATRKLTLKIEYQGEVRRFRDWPSSGAQPSVEELRSSVCQLFGLQLAETDVLTIKYRDDEGDLCTIGEPSLADALMLASDSGILRLTVTLSQNTQQAVQAAGSRSNDASSTAACEEPAPKEEEESSPLSRVAGFISERLTEGRQQASLATDLISERFEEGRHHATQQLTEVHRHAREQFGDAHRNATENLTEAHRHAREQFGDAHRNATEHLAEAHRQASEACKTVTDRFDTARPHLCHGVNHFKQQVAEDFKTSRKDMEDAFGAEEHQGGMKGKFRTVAGATTGLISALRFAPVRATRLAAHSVASLVHGAPPVAADTSAAQAESNSTTEDTTSMTQFAFRHQVKQDFKTAREDVKAAFDCITRDAPSTQFEQASVDRGQADALSQSPVVSPDEQCDDQPQQRLQQEHQDTTKVAIPEVVSAVAGASVAACLVPLRAARLAVATVANHKAMPTDERSRSDEAEIVSADRPVDQSTTPSHESSDGTQ